MVGCPIVFCVTLPFSISALCYFGDAGGIGLGPGTSSRGGGRCTGRRKNYKQKEGRGSNGCMSEKTG